MPYTFLYFNKSPKESGVEERDFEFASHLVDEINMRLDISGNQFQEVGYQTPIKLSEIKLFDVESISYRFLKFTKPRLLYLPRSSYEAALKKGTLYDGLPITMVGVGGKLSFLKAIKDIPKNMVYEEIKTKMNSLSAPCFLVVGNDNEDIEKFKEKWAIATNQPYYFQDVMKAFFLGIFTFFSNFFSDQEQKQEQKNVLLDHLKFPQVPVSTHTHTTQSAFSYVNSSVLQQPCKITEKDEEILDELLDEGLKDNSGDNNNERSWCNIL